MLPGFYPNALRVPPRQPARVAPTTATPPAATATTTDVVATTTVASVPAPMPMQTATVTPVTDSAKTPSPAATTTTTAVSPVRTTTAPAVPVADPLARFKPHPAQAFIEITGADATLLHANGVLFLDARRTSVYEDGHIVGARSFSVWESDVDDKVNALYGERSDPRDQDRPIVIYCSGGACEDSHMLSQKLWGIQFNNIYVYKDGFPDWQDRGGAVRTGGQP